MRIRQRNHVVDVQLTRRSNRRSRECGEPLPLIHRALPVITERDGYQTLLDEDLMPRVLTITVVIRPVPPIATVIGWQIR